MADKKKTDFMDLASYPERQDCAPALGITLTMITANCRSFAVEQKTVNDMLMNILSFDERKIKNICAEADPSNSNKRKREAAILELEIFRTQLWTLFQSLDKLNIAYQKTGLYKRYLDAKR